MTDTAARPDMVRPLDEGNNTGWHDDKGRFCEPLSSGYYIKYPKKDDVLPVFMAWHHNTPVGGSSLIAEAIRLAQDHHASRILSALSPAFIERMAALEAENARLREAIKHRIIPTLESYADPTGYTDGQGNQLSPDEDVHEGLLAKDTLEFARTTIQEHAENGERQGDEG